MIGTPNIMAKVSRSRRSCWISLTMMARRRCHMSAVERVVVGSSHEVDEGVLEGRFGFLPVEVLVVAEWLDGAGEGVVVGAADMERRTEGRRRREALRHA